MRLWQTAKASYFVEVRRGQGKESSLEERRAAHVQRRQKATETSLVLSTIILDDSERRAERRSLRVV